jgi:hypothetical protein
MATRPFEIKIKDADINVIRKTFKNMDEIAQNDMNRAAQQIAIEAASAVGSALQSTPQGQAIARSIKVSPKSKTPFFTVGGSSVKLRNGTPVGEIALGVEFGAYQDRPRKRKGKSTNYVGYRQFHDHHARAEATQDILSSQHLKHCNQR